MARRVNTFYVEAFWIALRSISEHKLRAFLTLLGVIIGVASVVVVGASISGLNTYVTTQVTKILGANHFMMARIAQSGEMNEDLFEEMNKRNKDLTMDEYEYIKERCKTCSELGAQADGSADINRNGIEMTSLRISGITPSMEIIEDKKMAYGRFINVGDLNSISNVVVIGWDIKEKFFKNSNPIGKKLKIQGIPLRVVGVEEKKGSIFGQPLDRSVYIPISLHFQFFGEGSGLMIHGKSEKTEMLELAIDEARSNLRNRRKLIGSEPDTFAIVNTADLANQIDQFTGAIAGVVIPITMITLLVGGIVVMNIMLVSVTERTFEVGLRKAIGASRNQILLQFLIESASLCLIGGIIGLLVAVIITSLVTFFVGITMTITIPYVFLAVFVSSGIGILAGLYPAYKASQLDPIVALSKN